MVSGISFFGNAFALGIREGKDVILFHPIAAEFTITKITFLSHNKSRRLIESNPPHG